MSTQTPKDQLVVRQHERLQCRVSAHARIADDHADQVVFARTIGDGSGVIDVYITDCSRGGVNIESSVFVPRGCRLCVRLVTENAPESQPIELLVRVQRLSMIARTPTYSLGASFVGQGPTHDPTVAALLDIARRSPPKSMPRSDSEKGAA